MPTTCWPAIRGIAARFTKLDSCGMWVPGLKSSLATDAFTSIEITPQYEDGEETVQKNAAGRIQWIDKMDDQLKNFEMTIKLTGANPDLYTLLTGQPVVVDYEGNAVGVRIGQTIRTDFALETWTDVPGVACAGAKPYGYFLLPWLHGARLAGFTIENKVADFTFEKAVTMDGSPWGVGPYDVDLHAPIAPATTPAPGRLLTPIGPKDHHDQHVTLVPPPPVGCAAVELVAP